MSLTAFGIFQTHRRFIPIAVAGLAAPVFFSVAVSWRIVSSVLPRRWFVWLDDKLYSSYQRFLLFMFENISGIEIEFYGDVDECFRAKENVLLICNHQSEFDWALADILAIRQDSLGHVRYMLKHELQYLPLYGYYFFQHGCIYVRRKRGLFNQQVVQKQLKYLADLENPTWLVIFPEGTRFRVDKKHPVEQSASVDSKLNHDDNSFVYLLNPRSRGFHMALNALGRKLDAVYDVTVMYESTRNVSKYRTNAPDMAELVCSGSKPDKLYIHLKRIPVANIPQDSAGCQAWLYNAWLQKEKLLQKFFETRTSEEDKLSGDEAKSVIRLPVYTTLPYFLAFVVCTTGMLSTNFGRNIYARICTYGTVLSLAYLKILNVA